MSKFFKALELAEQERALQESAAASGPTVPRTDAGEPGSGVALEEITGQVTPPLEVPAAAAVEVDLPARPIVRPGAVELPPYDAVAAAESDEPEPHLVSLHTPTSFAAEQYRTLRHIIEHETVQVVAVTSPGVGDGKTTTTLNLGGALAQAPDARVLLIDCDLRRPAISKFIGLSRSAPVRGLVDLLLDRALPLDATIVTHRAYNLDVLPAGTPPVNPYELLNSPRLPVLIEEVRKRYQYVILDTPPAIPMPDCRVLGKFVDAFVVIVSANRTPRRLLQGALETLDRGKVLGLIFNKDEAPVGTYYQYQAYFPRNGVVKSPLRRMVSRVLSLRPKPATRRKKK